MKRNYPGISAMELHGLLLAGGRSLRMGFDKALLEWNGQPLWQHQIELLEAVTRTVPLVSAPERPLWLPDDIEWICDPYRIGPLGGIISAFEQIRTATHMLVVAIDMPQLDVDHLQPLIASVGHRRGTVASVNNAIEPLVAVYPRSALSIGKEQLQYRFNSVRAWVSKLLETGLVQPVTFDELSASGFLNINTPHEWRKATHSGFEAAMHR